MMTEGHCVMVLCCACIQTPHSTLHADVRDLPAAWSVGACQGAE
jgi:hypothetical protein